VEYYPEELHFFSKSKDEFLRDSTGDLGFGVHLSPGLMGLVSETLEGVGPAGKDFLLSMSQRQRIMMSQQVSEECQS
jgi:hypothetical protein